ncbi:hypothetical protein [Noviherbaspirillum denitrificans]|uniref:Pectate lyase superfamily protein domain-containing protein n=1 Tax=Noviherbaspirillum denitrificans TaxID=1968433 RepID=A0A254T7E1_9BURK|nr:hypothetical protein [Noviherbaspirillum denitrificans]OWW18560.1 hypothetical protein AYR66_00665 [Noviherbaspirillum denitrificans]
MGEIDQRRRTLFLLGAAALLPQFSPYAHARRPDQGNDSQVNLADHGGVPGADPETIIDAFHQAFAQLKRRGGGTLHVSAGVYDLGKRGNGTAVTAADLSNVAISAYGAKLTMTTEGTGTVTPVFFRFINPDNITISGMAFTDSGTDLTVNWFGAICFVVESTRPCRGFRTVDCLAENVVRLLMASQPEKDRYTFEGFDLHATIRNAYYGAGCVFNGANSRADLTVHNVRRAFIGYGMRNWELNIKASADGVAPGSNALVELAADHRGHAESIKVNLAVSGNLKNYGGLVTFYLQGPPTTTTFIRNVKANVTLNNVSAKAGAVFLFPYEAPGAGGYADTTASTWEEIRLSGKVIGSYSGTMIKNPSVSTGKTNSIYVDRDLVGYMKMAMLPDYFRRMLPRTGDVPDR